MLAVCSSAAQSDFGQHKELQYRRGVLHQRWVERRRLFLRNMQVFSDKAVASVTVIAAATWPVHVVLLNVSTPQRYWVTEHWYTLTDFLPI